MKRLSKAQMQEQKPKRARSRHHSMGECLGGDHTANMASGSMRGQLPPIIGDQRPNDDSLTRSDGGAGNGLVRGDNSVARQLQAKQTMQLTMQRTICTRLRALVAAAAAAAAALMTIS